MLTIIRLNCSEQNDYTQSYAIASEKFELPLFWYKFLSVFT